MTSATRHANVVTGARTTSASATILLVDDDDATRETTGMILELLGFEVRSAPGGTEALHEAKRIERVDLLLTDVRMPGMNGVELARQLNARFPGMPVLFMSGYASGALGDDELPEGATFIAKPFSIVDLESSVREALEGET
jgi:DNA-binding NtrC family response regulator